MKTSSEFVRESVLHGNGERIKALRKARDKGTSWEELEKQFKLKPTRGMAAYRAYNANISVVQARLRKAAKASGKTVRKVVTSSASATTVVHVRKAKPAAVAKPEAPKVAQVAAPVAATPPPAAPVAQPAPVPAPVVPVAAKKTIEEIASRLGTLFYREMTQSRGVEADNGSVARDFCVPNYFSVPEGGAKDWPEFTGRKAAQDVADAHFSGMGLEVNLIDDEKNWFTVRVAPK